MSNKQSDNKSNSRLLQQLDYVAAEVNGKGGSQHSGSQSQDSSLGTQMELLGIANQIDGDSYQNPTISLKGEENGAQLQEQNNLDLSPLPLQVLKSVQEETEAVLYAPEVAKKRLTSDHLFVVHDALQKEIEAPVKHYNLMLVDFAEKIRKELFDRQIKKQSIVQDLIKHMDHRAYQMLQKEKMEQSVNYDSRVRGDRTKMHKLFDGKLLANKVASKVVVEYARTQNMQISIEQNHIVSIKQSCGYDIQLDKFTENQPISFFLEPRHHAQWVNRENKQTFQNTQTKNNKSNSRTKQSVYNAIVKTDPSINYGKEFIEKQLIKSRKATIVSHKGTENNNSPTNNRQSSIRQFSGIEQLQESENQDTSSDSSVEQVLFQDSHLFQMLQKEPSQRTERDLRDLRQIVMEIDFIKNNENNLQIGDLAEMIKYARVAEYPSMTRISSEQTESKDMLFVMQGTMVATYSKITPDKRAQFVGRKDSKVNPDDMFNALKTISSIKVAGEQGMIEEFLQQNEIENEASDSGDSRFSKASGASRVSHQQNRRLKKRQQSIQGKQNSIKNYHHKQRSEPLGSLGRLKQMVSELGSLNGESVRQQIKQNEPLNKVQNQQKQAIDELVQNYCQQVTHKDHYVQKRETKTKFYKQPLGNQLGSQLAVKKSSPGRSNKQKSSYLGDGIKKFSPSKNDLIKRKSLPAKFKNKRINHAQVLARLKSQEKPSLNEIQKPKNKRYTLDNSPQIHIEELLSPQKNSQDQNKQFSFIKEESSHSSAGNSKSKKSLVAATGSHQMSISKSSIQINKSKTKKPKIDIDVSKTLLKVTQQRRTSIQNIRSENNIRKELKSGEKEKGRASNQGLKNGNMLQQNRSHSIQINSSTNNKNIQPKSQHKLELEGHEEKGDDDVVIKIMPTHLCRSSSQESSNTSDDSSLGSILDHMLQIKKSKETNEPNEIPLFNLKTGQWAACRNMRQQAEDGKPQSLTVPYSLYTRRNRVFILFFSSDKFYKAIENAKNRVKLELLDFMSSVSLLSQFNRNTQKHLMKFLVKRTFNRHQAVYSEGEQADRLYFVLKGEFKITKKIYFDFTKNENKNKLESIVVQGKNDIGVPTAHQTIVSSKGGAKNSLGKIKQATSKKNQRSKVLNLLIVTRCGVLGEEDAYIEGENHSSMTTCKCISEVGEVYELMYDDFRMVCKSMPDMKEINAIIQAKRDKFGLRVQNKNQILKVEAQNMKETNEANILAIVTKDTSKEKVDIETMEQKSKHGTNPYLVEATTNMTDKSRGGHRSSTFENLQTAMSIFEQKVPLQQKLPTIMPDIKNMSALQHQKNQEKNFYRNYRQNERLAQLTPNTSSQKSSFQNHQQLIHRSKSNTNIKSTIAQKEKFSTLIQMSVQARQSLQGRNLTSRRSLLQQIQQPDQYNTATQSAKLGSLQSTQCQQLKGFKSQRVLLPINEKMLQKQVGMSSTPNFIVPQKLTELPQQQRMSMDIQMDILSQNRFLPSDLNQYCSLKNQKMQKNKRASSSLQPGLNFPNSTQELKAKQLPIIKMIQQIKQEKEERGLMKKAMQRDQGITETIGQAKTLNKQSRRLILDIKHKKSDTTAAQAINEAEYARANFLLRQAQSQISGQGDLRGSYGHKIKKFDEKVHGLSALTIQISAKKQQGRIASNY